MQISSAALQNVQTAHAVQGPDLATLTKLAVAADAANPATGTSATAAAAVVDPDPSKGGSVDTYA